MAIRFTLRAHLEKHKITPYRIAQEAGISTTSIYNLVDVEHPPSGIKFATLNAILNALVRLTGERIEVSDVIAFEYIPDDQ